MPFFDIPRLFLLIPDGWVSWRAPASRLMIL